MSTKAIYDAFCADVTTFAQAQSPELPVSWPNIDFTPPSSGQWLRVLAFWNDSQDIGMEVGAAVEDKGFFRIFACTRQGEGVAVIQDLADDIVAEFPKRHAFGGAYVERTPGKSGPNTNDSNASQYMVVTIRWRAVR